MMALWSDYTVRVVLAGSLVLGMTAGALGSFAVLRRQSLLGDAIAHAALPGVGLAFWLTLTKDPWVLLLGAALSGWCGTLFVKLIKENTPLKEDTALGIVLSVFFGVGLVILTTVQRLPTATKAGLDKFLFGSAATLLKEDVIVMTWVAVGVFAILMLFWKEFKIMVFDPDFAQTQGLPYHFLDILMTSLIVFSIVMGLQTVGVVLMSALLIAPGAAARQWARSLGGMVVFSAFLGAACAMAGALCSASVVHLPTGPVIVVFLSLAVFLSLFFAPHRGLASDWLRRRRQRRELAARQILEDLLLFSEIPTDPFHAHDLKALNAVGREAADTLLRDLETRGLIERKPDGRWALTPHGLKVARRLTRTSVFEENRDHVTSE